MNTSQDFNRLYRDVSENMASAMAELSSLRVDNNEGRERLTSITRKLSEMQKGFDEELEFLETHAEWERFTMAFFGETNAGKSTIIESLRILFNEQSRRELIEENRGEMEKLSEQVYAHADYANKALAEMFQKHAEGVSSVRQGCLQLSAIVREEAAERIKVAEQEFTARMKRKIAISGVLGAMLSAALVSAAFMVQGG
jgi:hypothetical protein